MYVYKIFVNKILKWLLSIDLMCVLISFAPPPSFNTSKPFLEHWLQMESQVKLKLKTILQILILNLHLVSIIITIWLDF